jgi:hypothetical protein
LKNKLIKTNQQPSPDKSMQKMEIFMPYITFPLLVPATEQKLNRETKFIDTHEQSARL